MGKIIKASIGIIKDVFVAVKNNKALWVLGFVAALTSAGSVTSSKIDIESISTGLVGTDNVGILYLIFIPLLAIFLVVSAWGKLSIIDAHNKVNSGSTVNIKDYLKVDKKTLFKVILMDSVIPFLVTFTLSIVVIPLFFLLSALPEPYNNYVIMATIVIGGLALLYFGIFLGIAWYFAQIDVVLNKMKIWPAFKDSMTNLRVKGVFAKTFCFALVISLFSVTASFLVSLPMNLIIDWVAKSSDAGGVSLVFPYLFMIIYGFIMAIIYAFVVAINIGAWVKWWSFAENNTAKQAVVAPENQASDQPEMVSPADPSAS